MMVVVVLVGDVVAVMIYCYKKQPYNLLSNIHTLPKDRFVGTLQVGWILPVKR